MHVSEFHCSHVWIHTVCEYSWWVSAKRWHLRSLQVAAQHFLSLWYEDFFYHTRTTHVASHPDKPWCEFIFIHIHFLSAPPCAALSLICVSPPFPLLWPPLLPPCLWGQWPRQACKMRYWCGWIVSSSSTYSPSCLISVEGEEPVSLCVCVCPSLCSLISELSLTRLCFP